MFDQPAGGQSCAQHCPPLSDRIEQGSVWPVGGGLPMGRIGTVGRARRVSFQEPAQAQAYMQGLIRRRIAARRRIGVPYQMFAD
jgi:hypothetical protein